MSDEPTERDVEALAAALHEITCQDNPGHAEWEGCATTGPCADESARLAAAFGYAERIAQARREGAAEVTERVESLHRPDPSGVFCDHCWRGPDSHSSPKGTAAGEPFWPCATVRALRGDA